MIGEIIISLLLIVLLSFFVNPLNISMPHSMHTVMVPLLVVLFVLFAATLWRENPYDEREQLHTFIASRFAYFAGIAVLLIAIIVENMQHSLDVWLVIAACLMLLAKFLGQMYGKFRK